jgi:hypothetical protein
MEHSEDWTPSSLCVCSERWISHTNLPLSVFLVSFHFYWLHVATGRILLYKIIIHLLTRKPLPSALQWNSLRPASPHSVLRTHSSHRSSILREIPMTDALLLLNGRLHTTKDREFVTREVLIEEVCGLGAASVGVAVELVEGYPKNFLCCRTQTFWRYVCHLR